MQRREVLTFLAAAALPAGWLGPPPCGRRIRQVRSKVLAPGCGDAPVQAYIAAMPGWKRDIGRRLDALITRTVPGVRKAVKWNSLLYGVGSEGNDIGWF